jgi:hypothetical protein
MLMLRGKKDKDGVCYYVDEFKIANKAILEIALNKSGYIYIRLGVELVNS